MKTNLIHSDQEYFNFMRSSGYWANPSFDYENDWHHKSHKPQKYPCLVLHQWTYNTRYGRNVAQTEFVYPSDFKFLLCSECKMWGDEDRVLYSEDFDRWMCSSCYEGIEGEAHA